MAGWSDAGNVRGPTGRHPDRNGNLLSNRRAAVAARRSDASRRNLKGLLPLQGLERMNLNFPYRFDGRGRTLDPSEKYVAQLIEQVLFTTPGERVNMPDFGSGLLQLAFAPTSIEMAAATQFAVQGALQKWLGNAVKIQSVTAAAEDAVLTVTVTYSLPTSDVTKVQTFVYGTSA
jgi:hypothetical protein